VKRASKELSTNQVEQNGIIKLPDSDVFISLDENVNEEGMLRFNIQNGDSPFVEHVHINIKTWFGEANFNPWKNIQSSGAYIFNPA